MIVVGRDFGDAVFFFFSKLPGQKVQFAELYGIRISETFAKAAFAHIFELTFSSIYSSISFISCFIF